MLHITKAFIQRIAKMTEYHVNPDTKEVGVCQAEYSCRFDGQTEHYDTEKEAQAASEALLEEEHGSFYVAEKRADNDDKREVLRHQTRFENFHTPTQAERVWKDPTQLLEEGSVFRYEGDLYQVSDEGIDEIGNNYVINLETGGTVEIEKTNWRIQDEMDFEIIPEKGQEFTEIPPGSAVISLSDYISSGDRIDYLGEEYTVKSFEYNRALLAYEIETEEKGTIHVSDYDWYENNNVKIRNSY